MSLICPSPFLPLQFFDYSHDDLMKIFCILRLKGKKNKTKQPQTRLSLLALKILREETLLGSSFNS